MFGGGGRESESLGRLTQMMMPIDEDFPRRDERVPQWSQQETRDFIGIRAELETNFTLSKRNKNLWEVVSAKMKERGYRRTPDQCKCKWKNLVNRYKGTDLSDWDSAQQCPFFEELHAVLTERANNMQAGSVQVKKKVKKTSKDHSSDELSEDEDDDEDESEEERATKSSNPRKRKAGREKQLSTSGLDKPSRQPSTGTSSLASIQEMLRDFIQQQQRIDMEWRETIEKRAYERQVFEHEWRQTMEKLERERLAIEQAWKEREEQRRTRDEIRAEKRDALLTTLLNKLIHEK